MQRSLLPNFLDTYPHVPLLVVGDFNVPLFSPEFQSWAKNLNFVNPFDEHFVDTNHMGKVTYTYFNSYSNPEHSILDYILIFSNNSVDIVEAQVYRYRNEQGEIIDLPQKTQRFKQNPSDHYPIFTDLRIH